MISITKLDVRSYDLDHLDIFWEIPEVSESLEDYDFFVLRSIDGVAGPYRVLAGPFYNTFVFRDVDVHRLNKWRQYYYKIRVVHRASQKTQEFGPQWLRAQPDLLGMEFQRRELLLLREFSGRVAFLFPVLTFGERCGHCWDLGPKYNTIGRSKHQNCATCFDTTFVGGFASPIRFYLQIDPSPKAVQRTDLGEEQFNHTTARTTSFPPVKPKDIIVEAENRRWLVNDVASTEKLRSTVRQELKIFELPRDDIKMKVPVDFDLLAEHSPRRAFSRPMSLQAEGLDSVGDTLEGT